MDDWGADPSVQRMRKIFSAMNEIDNALIKSINLSPFDLRLKDIRTRSRELFEKTFSFFLSKGTHLDDDSTIDLYRHCHINSFKEKGITLPDSTGDINDELLAVIKEVSE